MMPFAFLHLKSNLSGPIRYVKDRENICCNCGSS